MNNHSSSYTLTVLNLSPVDSKRFSQLTKEIEMFRDEYNKQTSQLIEWASRLETDTSLSQKDLKEQVLHLAEESKSFFKEADKRLAQFEEEITNIELHLNQAYRKNQEEGDDE